MHTDHDWSNPCPEHGCPSPCGLCKHIDNFLADTRAELMDELLIQPVGDDLFAQISCDGRIVDYFSGDDLAEDIFADTPMADIPVEPYAYMHATPGELVRPVTS